MKRIVFLVFLIGTTLSGQKFEKFQVGESVEKNPQKAMLMSAVIPGSGQFYTKSVSWGIFYSALEVAGISGIIYYQQTGNDKVDTYKSFANEHWDVVRWLDDYYREYENPWSNPAAEKTHNVYLYVGNQRYTFAEFIQTYERWEDWQSVREHIDLEKEYHFYENISKYKQFKQGWDDWEEYKNDPAYQVLEKSSPNQERYAAMRKKANDLLKHSTYFSSAIMFNHVISAFDAYFRTTRWNKFLSQNVHLKMIPSMYTQNQGLMIHLHIDLAGL
ncbi:MAG: DUF5683 domain-containing protein [Candidatus Marinimicrobia bacterium]|nr:DUF5683 domain-containing protein [Candidatus Neomarinimicrobiota bacterium]MDD5582387.1 DUF5683 domain-containing protein [Candidatus Neomarinimicrobiota bacterium]